VSSFNKIIIAIAAVLIASIFAWPLIEGGGAEPENSHTLLTETILGDGTSTVLPVPLSVELDPARVALGEKLFANSDLSGNGFSCATCHPLERGGMDGLTVSRATDSAFDEMNTPTVFNSAFNATQLWNGGEASLESQLDSVITNPLHMNSTWPKIVSALNRDQSYVSNFGDIYDANPNKENIIDALVTFERSLITPNSDFDLYLRGNTDAITAEQKIGFQLFQDYGCISCHQGINLGGNLFARFGIFLANLSLKDNLTDYDYGRYSYTKKQQDMFLFRVPSLRNVAVTAPYFHDGSARTLKDAISTMARLQLDIILPKKDVDSIEAFLIGLTGEYKGKKL